MNPGRVVRFVREARDFFLRHLALLWQSPIQYLYSFSLPNDKCVRVEPYSPDLQVKGEKLIAKIQSKLPDLKMHFIGSTPLGISGQRDIDINAESLPEDFDKYMPTLVALLGKPSKIRGQFCEWHVQKKTYSIEFLLSDPSTYLFRSALNIFDTLKQNKKLREEYNELKLSSSGLSVQEYQRKKIEFYNRIERIGENDKIRFFEHRVPLLPLRK